MYSIIQVKGAAVKNIRGDYPPDVLIFMKDGKVIATRLFKNSGEIFTAVSLIKLIIEDEQVTDLVIYCDDTFEIYDRAAPINLEGVDITFFRDLANKYVNCWLWR